MDKLRVHTSKMAETITSDVATVDSDQVVTIHCVPCSKVSKTIEAARFCVTCGENLCQKCVTDHSKFQMLANHVIADLANLGFASKGFTSSVPTCAEHPGTPLTLFCVTHDDVVCSVCSVLDHRSCPVRDVQVSAKSVWESGESDNVVEAAKYTRMICETFKSHEENSIKQTKAENQMVISEIQTVKQMLESMILTLEQNTTAKINKRFKQIISDKERKVTLLKYQTEVLSKGIDSIAKARCQLTEHILFTEVKGLKNNEHKITAYLHSLGKTNSFTRFSRNTQLLRKIGEKSSFGELEEIQRTSALPLDISFTIAFEDDIARPDVNGSCMLDDGTIVITDYNNRCLKRFDASFNKLERLNLIGCPFGVCKISETNIAITLPVEKSICMVSVGSVMSVISCFSTSQMCRGLVYNNNEFIVCCGGGRVLIDGIGCVSVYKKTGRLLRTISKDEKSGVEFRRPMNISMNHAGKIFIVDSGNELISMDTKGCLSYDARFSGIESACDIEIIGDHIIVSETKSTKLVMYNALSQDKYELLAPGVLEKVPRSVLYDASKLRLICFMSESDVAKVFALY